MSRIKSRPDTAKRPSYITSEGYRKLEEEAARLWRVERPRLAKAVAVAAAEGDRSENAEYLYSKKKLFEIDRRLQFLGKRLKALKIVESNPNSDGRVYFGCWVVLEDEQGKVTRYRIVGPDESDANKRWISLNSPMAKALLGKREGDSVLVHRPIGDKNFTILEISLGLAQK